MTLLPYLVSFSLVAGLVTITPGLDTALVLRTATRSGRRAAAAAALGINAGVLAWAVAATVGVSALLTASETAYTIVRYVGAAYMLWLGVGMLRKAMAGTTATRSVSERDDPSSTGMWSYFQQGILTNLLNPKVGAFYVAVLPQFIPPGDSPALVGALLAFVHNIEGLAWFSTLILAVDRMRVLLSKPAAQRCVDGLAGTAVIGFGLKLGLSRAHTS